MSDREAVANVASAVVGVTAAELSELTGVDASGPSLTQQQFAEETDINTIARRFGLTGELPAWRPEGVYGDFSGILDFESAVDRIARAREGFMRLPPEFRERFANDPGRLAREAAGLSQEEFNALVSPKVESVVAAPAVGSVPSV